MTPLEQIRVLAKEKHCGDVCAVLWADKALHLAEALQALIQNNEEWNADVEKIIGRPMALWNDSYLNPARQALEKAAEKP